MNHSKKRTAEGSRMCPNGLPAMDDKSLAEKVASLPLPQEEHRRAVLLTAGLVPGKFGLLRRADRDWLMTVASKAGALPRIFKKPKRPREASVGPDRYCDKPVDLPAVVMAQMGKIPLPPRRAG